MATTRTPDILAQLGQGGDDALGAAMGPQVERIATVHIRCDGGTQPRAGIDQAVVDDYHSDMQAGAVFPPVELVYDGTDYWLWDGFHRFEAWRKDGDRLITAHVRQGTRRDAVLLSVGANATHGFRRSSEDKRRAVDTLLRDPEWSQWSDREIGRRCAVDGKTVAARRAALSAEIPQIETRRVERNGSEYTMAPAQRAPGAAVAAQGGKYMTVEELATALREWARAFEDPSIALDGLRNDWMAGHGGTYMDDWQNSAPAPWQQTRLLTAIVQAMKANTESLLAAKAEADARWEREQAEYHSSAATQPRWAEIWELEQLVRRYLDASLQPEHHAPLLEKIDQAQYREQVAAWIDRQKPVPMYRPRDLVQAGKNVLEQMRQRERVQTEPTGKVRGQWPRQWIVEELVEELVALESVALDGADEDWLFDYMQGVAARYNATFNRSDFSDALRMAIPRQRADNERRERLAHAQAQAMAADAERARSETGPSEEVERETIGEKLARWSETAGGQAALNEMLAETTVRGFPMVGQFPRWWDFKRWLGNDAVSSLAARDALREIATMPQTGPSSQAVEPAARGREMEFERKAINQGKTVKLYGRNVDGTLTVTVDARTVHLYSPGVTMTRDDAFTLLRMVRDAQQAVFDPKEMRNA